MVQATQTECGERAGHGSLTFVSSGHGEPDQLLKLRYTVETGVFGQRCPGPV